MPTLAFGPAPSGFRRVRAALLHASGLALQVAEIVELGPAHLRVLDDFDLLDRLRVQREDPLHALAERDLAHGHGRARARAAQADDDALEDLDALALGLLGLALDLLLDGALLDSHVHAHGVARRQAGKALLEVSSFDTVDRIHFPLP